MENTVTSSGQKVRGNRFAKIAFIISFFILTVSITWSLAVQYVIRKVNETIAETVVNVASGPAAIYVSPERINPVYVLIGLSGVICSITAIIFLSKNKKESLSYSNLTK